MLFSMFSMLIGISKSMSQNCRQKYLESHSKDNKKEIFRMKIKCSKFRSHHKFIHKLLNDAICNALQFESAPHIDVYYTSVLRHTIIVYIEVKNSDIMFLDNRNSNDLDTPLLQASHSKDLFNCMLKLGKNDSKMNQILKKELNERLNLQLMDNINIDSPKSQPGQDMSYNINDHYMTVFIEKQLQLDDNHDHQNYNMGLGSELELRGKRDAYAYDDHEDQSSSTGTSIIARINIGLENHYVNYYNGNHNIYNNININHNCIVNDRKIVDESQSQSQSQSQQQLQVQMVNVKQQGNINEIFQLKNKSRLPKHGQVTATTGEGDIEIDEIEGAVNTHADFSLSSGDDRTHLVGTKSNDIHTNTTKMIHD